MNRLPLPVMSLAAAAISLCLGGCSTSPAEQAGTSPSVTGDLEWAIASAQPTFGVGDELGWLAFGDLALAPMPGLPTDVLVIAKAEPVDEASFDWVTQYLALAD